MRIGIVGAGAIGTWMATCLANSGNQVSVLSRGAALSNIRKHGVRVKSGEGVVASPVTASEQAADLGQQDLVIFAVKSPSLPAAALSAQPMITKQTTIMTAMNGVPWWFLDGWQGGPGDQTLKSVDPDRVCSKHLPVDQVVSCVVHASTRTIEPGFVEHVAGNGLIIGPANPLAQTATGLTNDALDRAGFDVTVSDNIRFDIWYKLWGNMTMNPLSAITGATCDLILDDPGTKAFATAVMNEASKIGAAIGCQISETPEARHDVTRKLGAFKTSMLRDAESGRALEVDALLGAPKEIATKLGIETPALDHLLGIMRVFEAGREI